MRRPTVLSLFSGVGGLCYNPLMPKGAKPKTYDPELVKTVKTLYEQGSSQMEIAAALSTTQKVIWRLMVRNNIPRRPQVKRDQRGEKNAYWKGGEARYQALHIRVGTLRGKPQSCEGCGASGPGRSYDWANLTGAYDDPSDYKRLCRSCHWKLDKIHLNLGAYAVRKEAPTP